MARIFQPQNNNGHSTNSCSNVTFLEALFGKQVNRQLYINTSFTSVACRQVAPLPPIYQHSNSFQLLCFFCRRTSFYPGIHASGLLSLHMLVALHWHLLWTVHTLPNWRKTLSPYTPPMFLPCGMVVQCIGFNTHMLLPTQSSSRAHVRTWTFPCDWKARKLLFPLPIQLNGTTWYRAQ